MIFYLNIGSIADSSDIEKYTNRICCSQENVKHFKTEKNHKGASNEHNV